MGAALTAVTPGCWKLLDRRAKQKTDITEQELQAIAKAMYEERLAEVCAPCSDRRRTMSRTLGRQSGLHRLFRAPEEQGGHMSFLPGEERKLEAEGWRAQRIAICAQSLRCARSAVVSLIRPDEIDRHLAAAGFAVDDRLRWMLELALYPAYRDVYAGRRGAASKCGHAGTVAPGNSAMPAPPQPSPSRSLVHSSPSVGLRRCQRIGCIAPRSRQQSG